MRIARVATAIVAAIVMTTWKKKKTRRLKKKSSPSDVRSEGALLVKFKSLETKKKVMDTCKNLKPNFYTSDDLSREKQNILYVLRQAKRKFPNKISGSTSLDGRIYVWLKTTESTSTGRNSNQRLMINSIEKLRVFCTRELGAGIDSFVSVWKD